MTKPLPRFLALMGMLLSLALLCLFLGGRLSQGKESAAPFESVAEAVSAAVDMSALQPGDNQMIRRLYGLQPADFEGAALWYPVTNMGAEEIFVVKLRDMSQQEAVRAAMEARVESQIAVFEGYGPAQVALLEQAVIDVQGNYLLLIVHPDAETARTVFRDGL